MESIDPVERREHLRVPVNLDIEVTPLPDNTGKTDCSVTVCRSRNVSGGGISFVGEARYQKDSLLRLKIPLAAAGLLEVEEAGSTDVLNVMGKVRWCKKNGDSPHYVTGVQFLNIYEQEFTILDEYVRKTVK